MEPNDSNECTNGCDTFSFSKFNVHMYLRFTYVYVKKNDVAVIIPYVHTNHET